MGILGSISGAIFGPTDFGVRLSNLNSQWVALNDTIDNCALTPSSGPAFSQFYADFAAWKEYYNNESSFVSSSGDDKTLADWTRKLQDYTKMAPTYCGSGTDESGNGAYIPGVKDPPAEETPFADLTKPLTDALHAGEKWAIGIGIGLAVLVVIILVAIVYSLTHAKFKGYGAEVG